MDSDCLIKLTKAGLKERVCGACHVSIPGTVRGTLQPHISADEYATALLMLGQEGIA
jgi:hypothetical protein